MFFFFEYIFITSDYLIHGDVRGKNHYHKVFWHSYGA